MLNTVIPIILIITLKILKRKKEKSLTFYLQESFFTDPAKNGISTFLKLFTLQDINLGNSIISRNTLLLYPRFLYLWVKLSAYVRLRVGVNDQRGWWGENWLISVATVFRCYFFSYNTFITGRKKKGGVLHSRSKFFHLTGSKEIFFYSKCSSELISLSYLFIHSNMHR